MNLLFRWCHGWSPSISTRRERDFWFAACQGRRSCRSFRIIVVVPFLFDCACFVLGKVLALLGNGQICVLFYGCVLPIFKRRYILNSIPYLELQRNIIAPGGFLKKNFHDTLRKFLTSDAKHAIVDCIRRCPTRVTAGNSPDGLFFTINAHFGFKILFRFVKKNTKMATFRRHFYLCCLSLDPVRVLFFLFCFFLLDFPIDNSPKFYDGLLWVAQVFDCWRSWNLVTVDS